MSDYDTWDGERDRMVNGAGEEDGPRVAELLDGAAASARKERLDESAQRLEELRKLVVSHGLFRSWDEGIWAFSSLIRQIRNMSREKEAPRSYQAFLDAIPSAGMNAKMTPTQTAFWYGEADAPVYGEVRVVPPTPRQGCALLLALGLPAGTLSLWWLLG